MQTQNEFEQTWMGICDRLTGDEFARAAALVAACAVVDKDLERALGPHVIQDSGEDKGENSLERRINLADEAGLLPPQIDRFDLHTARQLRNGVTHAEFRFRGRNLSGPSCPSFEHAASAVRALLRCSVHLARESAGKERLLMLFDTARLRSALPVMPSLEERLFRFNPTDCGDLRRSAGSQDPYVRCTALLAASALLDGRLSALDAKDETFTKLSLGKKLREAINRGLIKAGTMTADLESAIKVRKECAHGRAAAPEDTQRHVSCLLAITREVIREEVDLRSREELRRAEAAARVERYRSALRRHVQPLTQWGVSPLQPLTIAPRLRGLHGRAELSHNGYASLERCLQACENAVAAGDITVSDIEEADKLLHAATRQASAAVEILLCRQKTESLRAACAMHMESLSTSVRSFLATSDWSSPPKSSSDRDASWGFALIFALFAIGIGLIYGGCRDGNDGCGGRVNRLANGTVDGFVFGVGILLVVATVRAGGPALDRVSNFRSARKALLAQATRIGRAVADSVDEAEVAAGTGGLLPGAASSLRQWAVDEPLRLRRDLPEAPGRVVTGIALGAIVGLCALVALLVPFVSILPKWKLLDTSSKSAGNRVASTPEYHESDRQRVVEVKADSSASFRVRSLSQTGLCGYRVIIGSGMQDDRSWAAAFDALQVHAKATSPRGQLIAYLDDSPQGRRIVRTVAVLFSELAMAETFKGAYKGPNAANTYLIRGRVCVSP